MSEKKISNAEAISVLKNVVITHARANGQNYIASALEICLHLAKLGRSIDEHLNRYLEKFATVEEVGLGDPVKPTRENLERLAQKMAGEPIVATPENVRPIAEKAVKCLTCKYYKARFPRVYPCTTCHFWNKWENAL